MSNELAKKTSKAIGIFGLMRGIVSVLSMVSLLILAQMLTPEDFGLVALASIVVVALQKALQIPVNQVLILKTNPMEDDFNTAFTINVLRGFIMFLLLVLLAYPMASFYQEKRVVEISLAFAVSMLFGGFFNPTFIMFEKKFQAHKVLYLNTISQFFGVVSGIAFAIITGSFWSLVVGSLVNEFTRLILGYAFAPYIPKFSLSKWREMFSFSIWISLSTIMTTVTQKIDQILIGKFLGSGMLGSFNIGVELAAKPSQEFGSALSRGLFPAFSQIKDNKEYVSSAYRKALSFSSSIVFPLGVGISCLAEPIIRVLLGSIWEQAIIIAQVVGGAVVLSTVSSVTKALVMSQSKTKLLFRKEVSFMAVNIPLVCFGMYMWGLHGVLFAFVTSRVFLLFVNLYIVKRVIDMTYLTQFKSIFRQLMSSLIMAMVLINSSPLIFGELQEIEKFDLPTIVNLFKSVVLGALVYTSTHLALWVALGRTDGIETKVFQLLKNLKKTTRN